MAIHALSAPGILDHACTHHDGARAAALAALRENSPPLVRRRYETLPESQRCRARRETERVPARRELAATLHPSSLHGR